MMEFRRLTSAEDAFFKEAFKLYETSFPLHEQREQAAQAALMGHQPYHFDVILEDGIFCGILLHWALSGYSYIEHFAVDPALRGKSLGSGMLKEFCKGRELVILEIDPPVDELSRRREGFYRRLGFVSVGFAHVHPPYRADFAPHPLVVMSYPAVLDGNGYALFRRELAELVMRDCGGQGQRKKENL